MTRRFFWKVVNPEEAVLNVQSYLNAVQLSAQTAMRAVIGKSELSIMLAGRDVIGGDIRELIQERVNDWGIKAISVEIRFTEEQVEKAAADAFLGSDYERPARIYKLHRKSHRFFPAPQYVRSAKECICGFAFLNLSSRPIPLALAYPSCGFLEQHKVAVYYVAEGCFLHT